MKNKGAVTNGERRYNRKAKTTNLTNCRYIPHFIVELALREAMMRNSVSEKAIHAEYDYHPGSTSQGLFQLNHIHL